MNLIRCHWISQDLILKISSDTKHCWLGKPPASHEGRKGNENKYPLETCPGKEGRKGILDLKKIIFEPAAILARFHHSWLCKPTDSYGEEF
jgi:hypothetical protein